MRPITYNSRGFTLIEIIVVILVIGVIGTIATFKMNQSIQTAQYEQTKKELDELARAIVGNPEVYSDGARTDFGFVGDNGTLPPNLDALVQNPGGWSTWDGPYMALGLNANDFKQDAWNVDYTYTDTLIRSTGSGNNIDKLIAATSSALLSNAVSGQVADADHEPPGAFYVDSVTVVLTYPDGSGSLMQSSQHPDSHGRFNYTGVPIGNHTLSVIHEPTADTMTYPVAVYPARGITLDVIFPADLW
ncbi:MAG: prepilin-type N-terminal cleavage/methylation domain-containing protein [Candidatus Zixiibacteriota bacterium]